MSSFKAIQHKARLKIVLDCVDALQEDSALTLTGLGRGMKNTKTKIKHCIKRVCRFLGNANIHRERRDVYGFIAHALLKNTRHPIIVVDWSPVNHVDKQLLRASIPIGGRAFTLYEAVYPESQLGSQAAHQAFIRHLATLIPEGTTPIIVTDAGYKVPWFKLIEKQGWYWLGRVRGNSQLSLAGQWWPAHQLFKQAKLKPRHLGEGALTKAHDHPCQVVLYKKKHKGRKDPRWSGGSKQDTVSREHAKREREPWLLVSNLPQEDWPAERIIAIYTQRMQIEESFRDTKNERYGQALNFAGSHCTKRIEVLLMVSMLAQFALILTGKSAYLKGYYKDFQSNTERNRRVLSYFRLGMEILRRDDYWFSVPDICLALGGLKAFSDADLR